MTARGLGPSPSLGYLVKDNRGTALRLRSSSGLRYWRVVSRSEWPMRRWTVTISQPLSRSRVAYENGGAKLDHRAANRSCFWAE